MNALRRALLCVPVVLATVALAPAPALAQAPGTVLAGHYHNTSKTAGVFVSSVAGNLNVQISDSNNMATPKGGPTTTTHNTRVNIQAFSTTFVGQGCFDIAPSDFSFTATTASLLTTVTGTNGTCGGPAATFPMPFTLNVTWTATGPVTTTKNHSRFDCGGYRLSTSLTTTTDAASAVATFTPIFADPFAGQSQLLRTDDERLHAEGVSPDGCQPVGAIPGGAGPPPAGVYVSNRADIGVFFFSDTGPSVGIFVTKSTQTSTPKGGPSTTTNEFDVRINTFGGGTFGFGCFNLTPADFSSSGVQGATLSMTIKTDTLTCQGFPTSLPLPLTVNVVWAGIGPVATTHSKGQLQCLTYRLQGQSVNMTNLANVTATLTPLLSAPLTTNQGSLATVQTHVHTEGAQQPACHL